MLIINSSKKFEYNLALNCGLKIDNDDHFKDRQKHKFILVGINGAGKKPRSNIKGAIDFLVVARIKGYMINDKLDKENRCVIKFSSSCPNYSPLGLQFDSDEKLVSFLETINIGDKFEVEYSYKPYFVIHKITKYYDVNNSSK